MQPQIGLLLVALSLFAGALYGQAQVRRGGPNPDPWPGKKRLLVVADVQRGYHHDTINHAMGVIERMGRESGEY